MTDTSQPALVAGYRSPTIVDLGNVSALTGTDKTGNLSDGPPHGYGWVKGTNESEEEKPEAS